MLIKNALMTIASVNIEDLVNFYTSLLDKQPNSFTPNVYAEFNIEGMRLGIFQPKQTHAKEFANLANSSFSLCLEVSNLEKAIAKLTNLGFPPPGDITTASHGREIYAYDPDGNRIILYQANRG